jgi:hypothetical protein
MARATRVTIRTTERRQTVPFLWSLALALLALATCRPATSLSDADEAAIYAAVIRQIYTQDDTFGGTLQPPTLYLVRTTDDSIGDPDLEGAAPRQIPAAVQDRIGEALADLPTQIVWVEGRDQVPMDETRGAVAEGGAILTLGNLHRQDDGSVHVAGSIYVAMLAAGGQTYVVEQVEGAWEVTGTTGVIWMS